MDQHLLYVHLANYNTYYSSFTARQWELESSCWGHSCFQAKWAKCLKWCSIKPLIKINVGREWVVTLIAYSPTETVIITIADTIVLFLNVALNLQTPAGMNYIHDEQLEAECAVHLLRTFSLNLFFCFSSFLLSFGDICALEFAPLFWTLLDAFPSERKLWESKSERESRREAKSCSERKGRKARGRRQRGMKSHLASAAAESLSFSSRCW